MTFVRLLLAVLATTVAACDLPRDPEGTLAGVRGGTMRVGVIEDAPWAVWTGDAGGDPTGIEPQLVRAFAEALDARIEWVREPDSRLMEALEHYELDLVIGGLRQSTPWGRRVSLTQPYATTRLIVAVPPGAPPLGAEDLEGLEVAVGRGDVAAAAYLRRLGALPVFVEDLSRVTSPVAGFEWRLEALGFQATDILLRRYRHVLAVPPGENGWLVRLERFLRAHGSADDELPREAAR